MITEVAGIEQIDALYIQLLYSCQFRCGHCFHADRLGWRNAYELDEAISLVELMHDTYKTSSVCLLGGEPFLYRDLGKLLRHIKSLGMGTSICTNGYRICKKLADFGDQIDLLRISLEGLEHANDAIRHPGSFNQAIEAFAVARELGIATGSTMTVTATNIQDVVPLARLLQDLGVIELKLHHLRPIGYAADHPELLIDDRALYQELRERIAEADLMINVIVDEELAGESPAKPEPYAGRAPRIEADPRGYLTLSCNAVGADAHAMVFDKKARVIRAEANPRNEVLLTIPPVVYARA